MYRRTLALPKRLTGVRRATPSLPASASSSIAESKAMDHDDAVARLADVRAVSGMLASLAKLIEKARQQRSSTATEVAQQSVELGIAIAERLLSAAIKLDRQRLDRIVLNALDRLPSKDGFAIRAHPDDIALLQHQVAASESSDRWRREMTTQPDTACERGQLVLEAGDLFVDWDTQRGVAEIRTLLLDEIFTEA